MSYRYLIRYVGNTDICNIFHILGVLAITFLFFTVEHKWGCRWTQQVILCENSYKNFAMKEMHTMLAPVCLVSIQSTLGQAGCANLLWLIMPPLWTYSLLPSDRARCDEENGIYILLPSSTPCRIGTVVCLQTTIPARVKSYFLRLHICRYWNKRFHSIYFMVNSLRSKSFLSWYY